MNAEAHLISLGWAGPGNALNSHLKSHKGRGGLGLTKPLLVSQKKNTFGIGKKIHEPASGNDWWLKGFEKALQGVGTDSGKSGSEATSGTSTPRVSGYVGKHSGLYGFFVRGEQMQGTIDETDQPSPSEPRMKDKKKKGKKRKSEVLDDDKMGSSSHQDDPVVAKKSKKSKEDPTNAFSAMTEFLEVRDKERKRHKGAEKDDVGTQFQQIGAFLETRDDVDPALEKRKKKKPKTYVDEQTANVNTTSDKSMNSQDSDSETARKERRRQRKEEKRKRKQEEAQQTLNSSQWSKLLHGSNTISPEVTQVGRTKEKRKERSQ